MQLDIMDTLKDDEANEEETTHANKEDQYFEDQTFAAMNISEVHITPPVMGQTCIGTTGVWEEFGRDWWHKSDNGWWQQWHG